MKIIDWILFTGVISVLIWATFYCRHLAKDVSGFLVAGRKTRLWLGLSNQFSGGLGLVAIAYVGQQGFTNGFSYIWLGLFTSVIYIIIFGIYGFGIERLRASKAMTAGQYHEMRYSRGVRLLVGLVCGIGGVLNMAIFPITGAKYLCAFLDWPKYFEFIGMQWNTIFVLTAVLISLAIFFTIICGQVGVLLTDYLQSIVIAIALFTVSFLIISKVNFFQIRDILQVNFGEAGFNPLVTKKYGWLWVAWIFLGAIWTPFCFGPVISKNASMSSPKVTRINTLLGYLMGNGKTILMLMFGVGALCVMGNVIPEGCTKLEYNLIAPAIFLRDLCPPVITGILLAAFVSAFISTNDSYFLSWTSIWVNDVFCVIHKKPLSVKQHMLLLRLTVLFIGIFLYLFGTLFTLEDTVLEFLMLTGTIWLGGGIAVVFGLYWRRANTRGAYATVISTCVLPILHMICQKTISGYDVPSKLAGVVTVLVAISLMILLSLLSKKQTKFIDYSGIVEQSEKEGVS